jgi:Lipase (class 3)
MHRVVEHNKISKVVFTGYSMGGAIAMLASMFESDMGNDYPAITFAANGVFDLVHDIYGSSLHPTCRSTTSIWNFVHPDDATSRMDCQIGCICHVDAPSATTPQPGNAEDDAKLSQLHHDLVYSEHSASRFESSLESDKLRCICSADDVRQWNRVHAKCSFGQ